MRPIDHVRALYGKLLLSPAYRGGEARDCVEAYLPLERCSEHQLRAVWLKLDALRKRMERRSPKQSDYKAYLASLHSPLGFDEPCIYNNFGAN